jgi:hypothetical protein
MFIGTLAALSVNVPFPPVEAPEVDVKVKAYVIVSALAGAENPTAIKPTTKSALAPNLVIPEVPSSAANMPALPDV